jgi:hypothetical protein
VGKQKIDNTGPLTVKRMETVDDEFADAALGWMDKQAKSGKPFFCYFNSTRMHIFTHLKPSSEGKTGLGVYPDVMVEHDCAGGAAVEETGRSVDREEHDRGLYDRQRRGGDDGAGWRQYAIPGGEGHQLGRRISGADAGPRAQKPFTADVLARKAREVLDGQQG